MSIKDLGSDSLVDDRLGSLLGFNIITDRENWRKKRFYPPTKDNIIDTAIKSGNNVYVHVIKENIRNSEILKDIQNVKEVYTKVYYDGENNLNYEDMVVKSYNLFLNKVQGGRYIEDYDEYEILVLFIIRYIELNDYCVKFYKESTQNASNNSFYELARDILRDKLNILIGDETINYVHKNISEKYVGLRRDFSILGFNLYDDRGISIFKSEAEFLKSKIGGDKIKDVNRELFRSYEASLKTLNRKLCLKEISDFTVEKYINCYADKLKPENNNNQMQYEFLANIIKKKIVPKELIDIETAFMKFNSYYEKYESDEEYMIDRIKNISHTILGFSSSIILFRYFSYILNINMLSGYYDWIDSKKLDTPGSCGLLGDFNLFSNLFYAVLLNRYNDKQVFSCRFVLPNKVSEDKIIKYLDLSECKNIGDKTEFMVHKSSRERKLIKYDDCVAVMLLKTYKNDQLRFKIVLMKEKNRSYRFFNTTYDIELVDIYGNELEMGTVLEKKPTTHYELLMISKMYENVCYSVEFKDTLPKVSTHGYMVDDEYKGVKTRYNPYLIFGDNIDINDIYCKNTVFFSNIDKKSIIDRFRSKDNRILKRLKIYKIRDIRDNMKFKNFELELMEDYSFLDQSAGGMSYADYEKKDIDVTKIPSVLLKKVELYDRIVEAKKDVPRNVYSTLNSSYQNNIIIMTRNLSKHIILTQLHAALPKRNYIYYLTNEILNRFNIRSENISTLEITNSVNLFSDGFNFKHNYVINYINTLNRDDRNIMNNAFRDVNFDNMIKDNYKNTVHIVYDDIYRLPFQNVDRCDLLFLRNNINNTFSDQHINYMIILTTYLKCIDSYCKVGGNVILDMKLVTLKYQYQIYDILKSVFKKVDLYRSETLSEFIVQGTYAVCRDFLGSSEIIDRYYDVLKKSYENGVNSEMIYKDIYDNEISENSVKEIVGFNQKTFENSYEYFEDLLKDIEKYKKNEKLTVSIITDEQKSNTIKYLENNRIKMNRDRIMNLETLEIELVKTDK